MLLCNVCLPAYRYLTGAVYWTCMFKEIFTVLFKILWFSSSHAGYTYIPFLVHYYTLKCYHNGESQLNVGTNCIIIWCHLASSNTKWNWTGRPASVFYCHLAPSDMRVVNNTYKIMSSINSLSLLFTVRTYVNH